MSASLPPPRPSSLGQSLRKVAPFFAAHRRRIVAIAGVAVLTASLAAIEPLIVKRLFDSLLDVGGFGGVLPALGALVLILIAHELLAVALDRLVWRVRLGVNFELLQATVDRLHSLPLSYHRDQSVGATMTKIERGISGSMSAFSDLVIHLLPSLVYLCVSVVVMLRLELRLALVVLLFAPLPAIIGARASKEQMTREQNLMQRWTKIFARFNEVLSGIVIVKSFVMEEQEKRRFLGGVADANQVVLRGVGTDARTNAIKNTCMALARIVALAMGGWLVMNREISVGTLVAFVGYVGGLFHPVQLLTGMYQTLRRATVSLDCVLSILEAQDSLGDTPGAVEVKGLSGRVQFKNVKFEYRRGAPILDGIDLDIKPGELVAFVGPSGAGKSTLMSLLQRLYDPSSGGIYVDGYDLRSLKQRSLRYQIGVVLQEGTLFSDSIRDNIAFGRPTATDAEIEAAARAANAHDFISALPAGYDTLVGERGCKLSGGERQRIAIARALLKDAPILILDEATSALDAESEEKVQQALQRLVKGRTTFVIAHRLSTITAADRIFVLKDGRISEVGRHDELMRKGGYYASLVEKQIGGLIAKAA